MILTQLADRIEEQAKQESIRNVTDYSPTSFKAGYAAGARWILKEIQRNGSI